MSGVRLFLGLLVLLGLMAQSAPARAVETNVVTVLTPAFSGDLDRGRGASYVLKLQVQSRLVLHDTDAACREVQHPPSERPTSRGEVPWLPGQMAATNPDEARKLAILGGAQAILWGSISTYPDGVLVSPFLSLVDEDTDLRPRRPERQSVTTPFGAFALGHPTWVQAFDPIFIANADIDRYSYSKLRFCRGTDCRSPDRYRITRALSVDPASGVIVMRYDDATYTLSAKSLLNAKALPVTYLEGLTAFLRDQPNKAACGFRKIIADEDAPSRVRADAYYYLGMIALGKGRCPSAAFRKAYQQNDASFEMARALLVSRHLAVCATEVATEEATSDGREATLSAKAVVRLWLTEAPDPALKALVEAAPAQ